ncbi:MAG: NADH-quinone oxidoreductase subunit I [Deltaproteobacteria bacterium]|nr:NADH-quinone oxidoreductase subunit I [Deltaproteobacteria bacterium]
MIDYLREIISGTWSLFVGLGITIRYFFQPVVTVQYPYQTLPMTPRFRGHIELVKDEETGETKCIVCGMCQKACPSNCITVNGEKREGVKGKVLTEYTLDFTKCSLCGLCVESCTPKAITFSKDYNLAGVKKEAYIFDLKKRLEAKN